MALAFPSMLRERREVDGRVFEVPTLSANNGPKGRATHGCVKSASRRKRVCHPPMATYDGAKYPIRFKDSSQIVLSVEQDAGDPVISVDKNGMVHALREGKAAITGEYAGIKDEIEVTVESR